MKPKQTPLESQKTISSFLTKIKKPSVSGRSKFVAEKIAANLLEAANEHSVNETSHSCSVKCNECKSTKEKLKDAKILMKKMCQVNLKKDLVIAQLRKKEKQKSSVNILFKEFETSFNSDELKKNRSVEAGPKKDSTFGARPQSYREEEGRGYT